MINSDLELAFTALQNKFKPYTDLFSYQDGNARLKYSTERLERAFGTSLAYFSQNWIAVIINSVLDRLTLKGFDTQKKSTNKKLDKLFKEMNLQIDAYNVHESALITGEAFLIADLIDGELDIYYNDPRQVCVFYDENRPKVKSFAAKKWSVGKESYIDLYYIDRTEHYHSVEGNTAGSFNSIGKTPNPFKIIPVFHFRVSNRIHKGEIGASEISIQDAVNKLFSDLMVAAEFEAFKVRVFISGADPGNMKLSPDMKIWIPAAEGDQQPSNVIELGGQSLDVFMKPMNDLASTLAVTTRTPKHYFLENTGSNLSGEALIAMESPLTKKVIQRQENFSVTWEEVAKFLLEQKLGIITPVITIWDKVETIQPLTEAQIVQAEVTSGIPLKVSLKRQGWSEDELLEVGDSLPKVETQPATGE